MEQNSKKWQIWIDTGGTFTDCIAISPEKERLRIKVLSSAALRGKVLETLNPKEFRFEANWNIDIDVFKGYQFRILGQTNEENLVLKKIDFKKNILTLNQEIPQDTLSKTPFDFEITANEEAPILAIRIATKTPLDQTLPFIDLKLGSTKGTNALLERKGAEIAFLVTKGFKDLVEIGTQQRPNLFQLDIPPKEIYYTKVIEVQERLDASGQILKSLEQGEIDRIITVLEASKIKNIAISLLHAYRNPEHELQLKAALLEAGLDHVSISSELAPVIKILPRANTTIINAYLAPVIQSYFKNIIKNLPDNKLKVMTSAGGLIPVKNYHPKDSLLSGPAGGVNGAARISKQLGTAKILTFDMGGTSTDTAMYDEGFDYRYFTKVGEAELFSPALAIETVAAGGGSICAYDGYKLIVGPESAGAYPGPASYGAGGPLTITDINLLLGKMAASDLAIPINIQAAKEAVNHLLHDLTGFEPVDLLNGFEKIANEKMAEAIRKISVARGFDPHDFALVVFGGAGGLHACKVAEILNMSRVILPFEGGLLSAYGIGVAQIERMVIQQVLEPLDKRSETLAELVQQLDQQAIQALVKEEIDQKTITISKRFFYLRFQGQDSTLEIELSNLQSNIVQQLQQAFEKKYRNLFGHWTASKALELESIKVIATTQSKDELRPSKKYQAYTPSPQNYISPVFSTEQKYPVFHWENLNPGAIITGPAVLKSAYSTAFIEQSWQVKIHEDKNAVLDFIPREKTKLSVLKEAVELELFTNRFTAIAEEMGAQLQRTAFSVNIKERLDFSCAILDRKAQLLVNAPHIPVHLGSLGICARLVLKKLPLAPGDVIITNHPKYGGSHLPDVTIMSGVFNAKQELIAYVINRAHHAEIGGKQPGSMPPDATCLAEEGVVIAPVYLVKSGVPQWEMIQELFTTGKYPSRAFHENKADINAALASLRSGEQTLQKMEEKYGLEKLHHYMDALKNIAFSTLRKALIPYQGKQFNAIEKLDDGHQLQVSIAIEQDKVDFDFSGTSAVHPFNLNANISIVYSVVIYVLRLLCNQAIPLNEGLMQQVSIQLPTSFLNPNFSDDPNEAPAVVGGNTEVSQRLTDVLLKALGLAACSQGTMNNFLFGNDHFGYYETICGGCGAGKGFAGRSAVHQHMTNTKITDPEELELRYPIRLEQFAIRSGSGGQGQWKGGEGIIRAFTFLANLDLTIISQHRKELPYGLNGGHPGKAGTQTLHQSGKTPLDLEGIVSFEVNSGDQLIIKTPGGGGFGHSKH